jgi:hypothetical protein
MKKSLASDSLFSGHDRAAFTPDTQHDFGVQWFSAFTHLTEMIGPIRNSWRGGQWAGIEMP